MYGFDMLNLWKTIKYTPSKCQTVILMMPESGNTLFFNTTSGLCTQGYLQGSENGRVVTIGD
jgi:hypothetical protein